MTATVRPPASGTSPAPGPAGSSPAGARRSRLGEMLLLVPGGLAVALLVVIPVVVLAARSFSGSSPGETAITPLTMANYERIGEQAGYYAEIFRDTIGLAAFSTLLGAVVAFPLALGIVNTTSRVLRFLYVFVALSPLLISVVIRAFGWNIMLGAGGPVAALLEAVTGDEHVNGLLHTNTAIVIGLTHLSTPFLLLALIPVLDKLDPTLVRAAASLGAGPFRILTKVVLPLARPGLVAGSMISFTVCATVVVTPRLLGGRVTVTVPGLIYDQMLRFFNWNLAAAFSVLLMLAVAVGAALIMLLGRTRTERAPL